jgi:hypothetical protein
LYWTSAGAVPEILGGGGWRDQKISILNLSHHGGLVVLMGSEVQILFVYGTPAA